MKIQIPSELQKQLDIVRSAILGTQDKWAIGKQLFASGEENLELLNYSANYAFLAISQSLYESVVLGVCRLTDPSMTFGHENLSLCRIADDISRLDNEGGEEILKSIQERETLFEPLRRIRDKSVAHFDLKDFQKSTNLNEIDLAIKALIDIMNSIDILIGGERKLLIDWDRYAKPTWGDGNALLYKLRKYKEGIITNAR